jgi:hypothetical protein
VSALVATAHRPGPRPGPRPAGADRRSLSANTSRTLSVAVEDLYRAWRGRGPHKWLLGARIKVQRANENRSLRLDWPDQTSVEVYFWAKGERRSQVNVMHRQLASAARSSR